MAEKLTSAPVSSAEHPKAVVLLLLIHCLLLPPLCVGGGGIVGRYFVLHYFVSSFAIISLEKKVSWLLYFNCHLMSSGS